MDLMQMRYFYETAQSEHITNTARKLHIAQPALSQALRKLQNEVGCELFEPNGRGVRLTPEGRYLRDRVGAVLSLVDNIGDEMAAFSTDRQRTVTIQMRAADGAAVSAIADYRRERPDALFRLVPRYSDEPADIVVSGGAAWLDDQPADGARETRIEYCENILLVLPADQKGTVASIEDLNRLNLISLTPNHSFRHVVDVLCSANGISPRRLFECECTSTFFEMLNNGLGSAFIPEFSWANLDPGAVAIMKPPVDGFRRAVRIDLCKPETATGESLRFFEFYRRRVEAFLSGREATFDRWEGFAASHASDERASHMELAFAKL